MIVQVFLAQAGAGAFERTFKPESEFAFAGRVEIDDESVDPFEVVFGICNSYPTEMHAPERYLDQVITYRAGRNRSLSVGDVISIGEGFYLCASTGWALIERPSTNLINAFMAANEHIVRSS